MTAPRSLSIEPRSRTRPALWFAIAGAVSAACGISAWIAWITAGHAAAATTGADPVPTPYRVGAWVIQGM